MKESSCCFTGHRRCSKLKSIEPALESAVIKLIQKGVTCFYCGGAIGFDMLAEQIILKLKCQYPKIRLILVLPCKEQAKNWPAKEKQEYLKILNAADQVIYIAQEYHPACMQKRNYFLVDHSSYCICYYQHRKSGTGQTVNYALRNNCCVMNLADMISETDSYRSGF